MATIRRRGKRWQAQVRKAGATAQSSTWPTRAAAERWARRLEADIDDGHSRGGRAATGTLSELIERYRREVGGVAGFGKTKEITLRTLIRELGHVRLRDLDASHLIRFGRQRAAAGASPATVHMDLSYLAVALRTARAVFRLAIDDRPVAEARDALRMVRLVGRPRSRERRPSPEELGALFAYWRKRPRRLVPMIDLVGFAIGSCMRLGEICRIRRADLDVSARTILIRARKDPREPRDQIIPLIDVSGFDPLAIALRQSEHPSGRLFPHREATITRAFRRTCDALGIEDLRFHDLRHEGVSRLFEAGLSIEQVAMVSGHKSWAMLKRYTQLTPKHVTSAFPARAQPATS